MNKEQTYFKFSVCSFRPSMFRLFKAMEDSRMKSHGLYLWSSRH
jgi:hypothetical protein